jgi:hypothetical protein
VHKLCEEGPVHLDRVVPGRLPTQHEVVKPTEEP